MAEFKIVIANLRRAEQDLEKQLESVRAAISSLELAGGRGKRGRPAGKTGKRRKMSAKARKAISDAQKKRWAKAKAAKS